ncbi:glycoside hydrolase family 38 C-terminal domain-containing protein [Chitinophaga sp. MD30]|uniref:glycoside hydrolase family 38 C-terminal domain-containing protein n=1 Tax=Chitinophaga sp. MD30 TaxID=2033437 RepID=UPI0018DF259B|nr:glycoside hydrolase family 38 C-terminal domain-containing protein [Chitinophaga sp. MD30]
MKEWNERYQSPRIVLNTTDQLFAAFEQRYGKQLPVVKGDITPYWEDGAGSTAQEEGENRRTSLQLQQLTNAYAILGATRYDAQRFYEAWTNVLLFHEHTWGAHNSISQPEVPFVTEQWRIKRQFMQDARTQAEGLSAALLQPITDSGSRRIVVVNTLSRERSGPVRIAMAGKSVKDAQGRRYPLQALRDGGYVFVAKDVPALGTAEYEVSDVAVRAREAATLHGSVLSNQQVQVGWDTIHGSITQLSQVSGRNYAGQFREQGLNSYWYVPGLDPAQARSNEAVRTTIIDRGPVVTTVSLSGGAPGTKQLERRLSLYAGSDMVLLENVIDKQAIREKEAVHFGFPFDVPAGAATLDAGYGTLRYVADQLPGSNMDFLYGRRWMDVSAGGGGVQWLLLEAPMVEPGQMTDERRVVVQSHRLWRTAGGPTSTWFSYVMNNYWHTNYKADQSGVSRYHYALRPHRENDGAAMEQAAADFTQPLLAIPVRAGVQLPRSLFRLSNPSLTVTSVTPQAGGRYVVRVFNPQAEAQQTRIEWGSLHPGRMVRAGDGQAFSPTDMIQLAGMGVAEYELLP